MKKMYLLTAVLFLAFLGGCQQQTLTKAKKQTIKKEVKTQFKQMVAAAQKMDVDTWSGFFSKDKFVAVVMGTDYINDRSQFLDVMKNYFSMRESQKIDSVEVHLKVLSSSSVLLTSTENFEVMLKDGTGFKLKDAFSTLWQKEQAGWKVIYAHESWSEIK